jgi:alkanesulfonate monooxygenase SsuD/methylene tetrahydromethanopterin reductase-like flavin-dependent oxidoreductase (luciferase family)
MVAVNAFVADTEEEARLLFSSLQQAFCRIAATVRPDRCRLHGPGYDTLLPDAERALLERMLSASAVGTPGRVVDELEAFARQSDADELIVAAQIFDHAARLRSFELLADAAGLCNRLLSTTPGL